MIILTCHTCPTIFEIETHDPWAEVDMGQKIRLHLLDNPFHVIKAVLK